MNLFSNTQEQPQQEAPEQTQDMKKPTNIVDAVNLLLPIRNDDNLSHDDYLKIYRYLREGEKELRAWLWTRTIGNLRGYLQKLGHSAAHRSGENKGYYLESIIKDLYYSFLMGDTFIYSWSYGEKKASYLERMYQQIEKMTPEKLKQLQQARIEEERKEQEQQEAIKKAIKNPKTLEDFRLFRTHSEREMTGEEKDLFDHLAATAKLDHIQKAKEAAAHVSKIESDVNLQIHQTKHSKKGTDIWTVRMIGDRLPSEQFNELKVKARKFGGRYSSFQSLNTTPPIYRGFNFYSEEAARKFLGLKESDQDASQNMKEREAYKQEKRATRLNELSERREDQGRDILSQDRKANTHRRARFAAHAEAKGQRLVKFAGTLKAIAEGLKQGTIKYLTNVNSGIQIEEMLTLLSRGFYKRIREEKLNSQYTERDPVQDIRYIEFPLPVYYTGILQTLAYEGQNKKGAKLAANKILKWVKGKDDQYITLKYQSELETVKKLAYRLDKYSAERLLDPIKTVERFTRAGLTTAPLVREAIRELVRLQAGTGISQEEKNAIELKQLERTFIGKKIPGFFPTPAKLIKEMLSNIDPQPGQNIWEPSAGLGHIADAIKAKYPECHLLVTELNYSLREVLERKGHNPTEQGDCLEIAGQFPQFDFIVMNPPFENNQDIKHIEHCYKLLKPNGTLISIVAGNKRRDSQNAQIQQFMEFVDEHGEIKDNEPGAFTSAFNPTGVNTQMVILTK